jgi:hypothetical protein
MTTKPALQKILKGTVYTEEEKKLYTSTRAWERINAIRRTDKQMRNRKG